jgi:hypothetical protein
MLVLEGERHEKVLRISAEERHGEKRSGEKVLSEKTRRKKPPQNSIT